MTFQKFRKKEDGSYLQVCVLLCLLLRNACILNRNKKANKRTLYRSGIHQYTSLVAVSPIQYLKILPCFFCPLRGYACIFMKHSQTISLALVSR